MKFVLKQIQIILNVVLSGIVILLAGVQPVSAQRTSGDTLQKEYGSIPDSVFQMEFYKPDPSAPFFYPIKELNISFEEDDQSIIAIMDYHVRIKVFDSSVQGASVVAIPYYFERGIEQIQNIRGTTYTASDEHIPLPDDAIKTININSRYDVKEFTMPGVEDGAVLDYAYRIRRRYIEELPDFYLAHQAPTALARVSITYPKYLRYNVIPEHFDGTINHHTEQIDTSSVAKVFTVPQPLPIVKETWSALNIPAIEKEAYISSLDDYRGKLKFQLSEFGLPRQQLENSWDFVVAEIRRSQNPLKIAAKNKKAHELGRSIRNQFASKVAAQDSIFKYLNSVVHFNEGKSSYSNTTDSTVIKGVPSDQAAINQTLLAMLGGADIKAYPVLISTREYGRINKSFPSFFQFNGQLVYSEIGDKTYFMDASFQHSQPNLIPIDTYNETGLLLKPDSYSWVDISPSNSLFSIKIQVNARLETNGSIAGHIRSQSFGYPAQVIRKKDGIGKAHTAIIKEAIFDGYNNIQLSDITFGYLNDYGDPVNMSADFALEDYATSFTDGLKFRPLIVGYLMSNPFNEGRRELPVTLDAPEKLDLEYDIRIPNGYTLGGGDENHSIELPGARLTESYQSKGSRIHYEFHINISQKKFEPELYPQLLDLYKRWVKLSNGSWLIKKK